MTSSVGQAALDRALADEDLLLVYQPIHETRSGKIVSAEALLRQRRRSGEIREASIITKTAEEGNEMFVLDSWTMRTAYSDAAGWQSKVAPDVHLNVNLSPREFQEGDVVARLSSLVEGCCIDVHKLNLEITETSYIDKPKETVAALESVKALGASLWLDDFGTKFSTITHLQHFPLDGIKIAGTFISGLEKNDRCPKITRALIALAHELGLKVTAEEVETQSQLEFLREADCDFVQGFLLSKPMTIEEFTEAM